MGREGKKERNLGRSDGGRSDGGGVLGGGVLGGGVPRRGVLGGGSGAGWGGSQTNNTQHTNINVDHNTTQQMDWPKLDWPKSSGWRVPQSCSPGSLRSIQDRTVGSSGSRFAVWSRLTKQSQWVCWFPAQDGADEDFPATRGDRKCSVSNSRESPSRPLDALCSHEWRVLQKSPSTCCMLVHRSSLHAV